MSENISQTTGGKITRGADFRQKKSRVTFFLTLLAVGVASLYAILCLALSFNIQAEFSLVLAALFGSCFLLNRRGYLDAARILLILYANGFVFYLSHSLGPAAALRPLYFPLIGAIFMLFDLKERGKIAFLLLVSFGFLALGEYTHYSLFLIPDIPVSITNAINPITFVAGVFTSLMCIIYLVSINTSSEEILDLERANIKAIIDNNNDSILLVDKGYKIIMVNEAMDRSFKRMYGDDFGIGNNILEIMEGSKAAQIPEQFRNWKQYYDRAFAGEKVRMEFNAPVPGGTYYVEIHFNPVLKGGEIFGAVVFVHDITQSRTMEENISKLNARQKAIIDGGNYSIISVGLNGIIESFNTGSENILGYASDEVVGKVGPQDFISMRQQIIMSRALSEQLERKVEPGFEIVKAIAEIGSDDTEWSVTSKSGAALVLSASITGLKNEKGEITGYLIISTDITEKKRAEELLRNAAEEDRKRTWISDGIAEISQLLKLQSQDIEKFYTSVLRFIAEYSGAGQAVLYGVEENETRVLTLLAGYAIDFQSTKKILQFGENLVGQAALDGESILLKDIPEKYIKIGSSLGETLPSQILILPLFFQDNVVGVAELASLRQFNAMEREFIDRSLSLIGSSIDLMNRNAKTERLLRESLELNEKLRTQEEELRVSNEELTEKGNMLQASEEELRVQQEELMHINARMEEKATQLEEQNEAILIKNTELETAREALRLKAEELEVTSRYKSEFLANMSHELRTPLNSILILSRLLIEGSADHAPDEKQVEFATIIQKSGTDLLNLINDILDLSKIESRKIDLEIEKIPFTRLKYSMESLFSELAKDKEVNFEVSVDPALADGYTGDQVRTEQVLKNLLSNAFKFTPKGGTVAFKMYAADGGTAYTNPYLAKSKLNICFEVSDTGIGISKEKQDLIFEAFRQADGSTSRKYGGTGLGLSISKELAMILGGELRLVSEAGKGSAFTLILPSVFDPDSATDNNVTANTTVATENIITPVADVKPQPAKKPEANPQQKDKKTLLIIEDDKQFGKLLKKLAQDKGFEAVVAERGDTGWEKIQELIPDAVLLDITLPVLDGWEIMKRMKADPKTQHIPVHIMSGTDNYEKGAELGAVDFLLKPVSDSDLKSVLDRINEGEDSKQRVLIVDESTNQIHAVKDLLSEKGFECLMAESGANALDMIRSEKPGIVITGLKLPDMSGAELVKRIKSLPDAAGIKIIIYTDKDLLQKENEELSRYSDAIIIQSANSQERLLDETTLFLKKISNGKLPKFTGLVPSSIYTDGKSLKGKKILLVDDDMRNIFALSSVLEKEELTVVVANDGKEALQRLEENTDTDMVLMDVMMPEMDGYEAIEIIRKKEKYAKLPIIALTAKAMKGDREKCIEAGASDYISKPIDINKLMSLMRVWLS